MAEPIQRTVKLFTSTETGLTIELPDWRYPIVVDTAAGSVKYDNYGGRWGEQQELNKLLQAYAVEKARIEARKKGHTITEQQLADGSIKLSIQVNGGAA